MVRAVRDIKQIASLLTTGITSVTSGRVRAARKRIVTRTTSPSTRSISSSAAATAIGIDPRCTGM
jgi:hypothetical protein